MTTWAWCPGSISENGPNICDLHHASNEVEREEIYNCSEILLSHDWPSKI